MKRHLQYTSEDYIQEADGRGVRPISNIDCQIITKIIQVVKQHDSQFADVLDQWKHRPDEDVLELIDSVIAGNLDPEQVQGEDQDFDEWISNIFIKIKNHTFKLMHIYSISTQDTYADGRPLYNLIINKGPLPAKNAWYENTVVKCYTKEDRDKTIKELEDKLKNYNCKFI